MVPVFQGSSYLMEPLQRDSTVYIYIYIYNAIYYSRERNRENEKLY